MTIYSLDVLLFLFGTSLLFHVTTREEHQVLHHNLTGVLCNQQEGAPSDETRGPPPTKTVESFPAKTREEPSGTLRLERSPCAANSDEATELIQEKPVTTRVEQPHEKQLGAPKQQVE